MGQRGRPPNPYQVQIHGVDKMVDPDDEMMPHEVDHAVSTLQRAEEIKSDPRMMAHVHEATGKKISSLKALRKLAMKKRRDAAFPPSSDESLEED